MRDRMVRIVAWIGVYETMNGLVGSKINALVALRSFLTFSRSGEYLWAFSGDPWVYGTFLREKI
eukprot:scaffold18531_cov56-Skeletonema_dohrnii-CCMP3373.AAC.1